MRTRLAAAAAAIGVGLLYVLSPIDVIPDVIPVLGLLDDALVLAVSVLTGLGFGASAIWLERRGRALTVPGPAYEPLPSQEIRDL